MFDTLSDKMMDAFRNIRGKGKISESNIEETLKEVRTALLEADVNFKVVKEFVSSVKEKALGEKVLRGVNPGEQFIKIMHDELAALMGKENEEIDWNRSTIIPLLIVGLNGAGKTTFAGKLSLYLRKKKNKTVFLIPADTFRPAAKEQLQTLAKNIDIECFDSDLSMHPKDIVAAGLKEAQRLGKNIVIVDTAGRLHVDEELMGELVEVKTSVESMKPEILLVADAMTGQEAVNVAQTFHQAVGLTGIVLSKLDSDARGGAALSIRYSTGVPIRYLSMGEKMKDLELFHPDRLAKRILDMGDVLTLVEKASEAIDEKQAEGMLKNLEKKKFTIEDFQQQMNTMNKMGSFSSLLKMIPGMGGMLKNLGDLSPAEEEMKKMKVIISSMTKDERKDHTLLNESRKIRIAKGCGKSIQDIRQFIEKFLQMREMMIGMMGMMQGGGGGGLMDMMGMPGMGGPRKGFRNPPPKLGGGKVKKKGKGKGPFGGGYF